MLELDSIYEIIGYAKKRLREIGPENAPTHFFHPAKLLPNGRYLGLVFNLGEGSIDEVSFGQKEGGRPSVRRQLKKGFRFRRASLGEEIDGGVNLATSAQIAIHESNILYDSGAEILPELHIMPEGAKRKAILMNRGN